jgi:5,10-methenyltetrahydrofolate synthetase
LTETLLALEPELIGAYWPHRSEFNAVLALDTDPTLAKLPIALPFAQRAAQGRPARMHFRAWDRKTPKLIDEVGIAASDGPEVVPDVMLVPCVGFTRAGFRLGYGGGFFDRWLAEHPHATTVGIAWAFSEIDDSVFQAQPHDLPLTIIITERGVV